MSQTLAQMKEKLRANGYLVDDDLWPTGAFHLLTIGSKKTGLNVDVLSEKLTKVMGISNLLLPRNPGAPNLYHFIAYRAEATTQYFDADTGTWIDAPFLVGEIEDYLDDVELAMVNPYPLADTPDNAVALAQAAEDWMAPRVDAQTPILIGDNTQLDAGTWYMLRVLSNTSATIRSGEIKAVLEQAGGEVLAPDEGAIGYFFWGSAAKAGSTRVFYRPSKGPSTGLAIQNALRGNWKVATAGIYTTEGVLEGQPQLDALYRAQRGLKGFGESTSALLDALEALLKAAPVALWVGVGLLSAYGLAMVYNAYQGRKKRSRA